VDACPSSGNGNIRISADSTGDQIRLVIEDNGAGISPEILPRIFDPYFTTKDPGKGTGLGLYLARDYIELKHAGKLNITSPGLGKGTKVTISVPKIPAKSDTPRPLVHNVPV